MIELSPMNPLDSNVPHTFDFSNLIASDDNISSIEGVTAAPSGLTIGDQMVVDGARPGCAVQCTLGAGTDRTRYIVTAEITTAKGVRLARSAAVPVGVV